MNILRQKNNCGILYGAVEMSIVALVSLIQYWWVILNAFFNGTSFMITPFLLQGNPMKKECHAIKNPSLFVFFFFSVENRLII